MGTQQTELWLGAGQTDGLILYKTLPQIPSLVAQDTASALLKLTNLGDGTRCLVLTSPAKEAGLRGTPQQERGVIGRAIAP